MEGSKRPSKHEEDEELTNDDAAATASARWSHELERVGETHKELAAQQEADDGDEER